MHKVPTIQLDEGVVELDGGLVVRPGLTESRLIEASGATSPEPFVHNGVHRSYKLPPVELRDRWFRPVAYFSDGMLTRLELSHHSGSGQTWDDWSDENERADQRANTSWLSNLLEGIGTTSETYTFHWGTLSSVNDTKAGGALVAVSYNVPKA